MHYLYLHGFASSPRSAKAQFLQDRFASVGETLHVPDLNQADFAHLTLSRQIQQAIAWLESRDRATLIGSSFGGLTAAWVAQHPKTQTKIDRLVLLAPAFQFLPQWLPRLGAETVNHWRDSGWLSVYHYGVNAQVPLSYDFVTDAEQYDETQLQANVPTLILHGYKDDVISIQASREYTRSRPWVQLIELNSDHSLSNVMPELWNAVRSFLLLGAGSQKPDIYWGS